MSRLEKVSLRLFAVLAAILLPLLAFRPIYWDELAYRILNSSVLRSGHQTLPALYTICRTSDLMETPLTWLPGRFLDSLLFSAAATPLRMRLIGLTIFICWLLLVRLGLRALHPEDATSSFRNFLPLVTLGVLPALYIWTRPENEFLIAGAYFLFFPAFLTQSRVLWKKLALAGIFIILVFWTLPLHPQIVVFLPFIAVSATIGFRKLPYPIISLGIILSLICWIGLTSFQTHSTRNSTCAEFQSAMDTLMANYNVMPSEILRDPPLAISKLITNLTHSWIYVTQIGFLPSYSENWMPSSGHTHWLKSVMNAILSSIFLCLSLLNLRILFLIRLKPPHNNLETLLLPLSLLTCTFLLAALQTAKPMYSSVLQLSNLSLIAIYGSRIGLTRKFKQWQSCFFRVSRLVAIMSMILFIPKMMGAALRISPAGNGTPTLNLSAEQGQAIHDLKILGNECGLSSKENYDYVGVDNVSYFQYPNARELVLINFNEWLISFESSETSKALAKALIGLPIDGMIARCEYFKGDLGKLATRRGGQCCLNKAKLGQIDN